MDEFGGTEGPFPIARGDWVVADKLLKFQEYCQRQRVSGGGFVCETEKKEAWIVWHLYNSHGSRRIKVVLYVAFGKKKTREVVVLLVQTMLHNDYIHSEYLI